MSQTEVLAVDPASPQPDVIARAASVLHGGGLVVFPTETVYGLGANALDALAVDRIFAAKGRPANNPLIVHVTDVPTVSQVAADWPPSADRLARRFWPGPLTLVLPKRSNVPDNVTAGASTVAVRVPANAVAQALLRAAGVPVAAPSANRSSELSPTRAEHVLESLSGRVDLVLDGGPTTGGLESTVLDLTTSPPRLLRPGLVGPGALEAEIGLLARTAEPPFAEGGALPSPGMLPRHYAPRTRLFWFEAGDEEGVRFLIGPARRVAWIPFKSPVPSQPGVVAALLPTDVAGYAARLYDVLHELDAAKFDAIVVELPPKTDEWLAVRDRLRRGAAAPVK